MRAFILQTLYLVTFDWLNGVSPEEQKLPISVQDL
jgi:hypothetical protein